jgi:hypothetical protein
MDLKRRLKLFMLEKEESEYQKFFKEKMKKYGVSSPAELSDDDKKKFFDEVKADWAKEKKK